MRVKSVAALTGGILMLCASGLSAVAQDYPTDTITLTVGYAAGGQADALARAVGDALSTKLGTTVVIENKPGANGLLAAQTVANAEPDGYNLLLVTDAMVTIEPQLAESQQWDAKANLAPVIDLGNGPLYVAVNTATKASTIPELIEEAKAGGRTLSFGTSGTATPHRMAGETLSKMSGVPMKNVSYKGTSAAVTDLAGGQIDMVVGASTSIQPLIDAGKVKLVATTGRERSTEKSDVPAVAETYPGFDFGTYFGIMAPKETPVEIVAKLNQASNEVLKDPVTAQALAKLGVAPVGGTPEAFQSHIDADFETRGAILAELGLKAN